MIILTLYQNNIGGEKMKGIKLVLLSVIITAMLASCGMNSTKNTKTSPSPAATDSGNVSDTDNGTISDKGNSTSNDAGNAVKDAGDIAGDAAKDVGDVAGDIADGAGNAVKDAGDAVGNAVNGSTNG